MDIAKEIGCKIKFYRKHKKLTIEQLAAIICKSKSCLSKYENGTIAMDVLTLYDIAKALEVQIDQLLYFPHVEPSTVLAPVIPIPAFFKNLTKFYLYYYDGRIRHIVHSVADISPTVSPDSQDYPVRLYMNIKDYEHYQVCETTYVGRIHHDNALSGIILQNMATPETYQISIPHPYMNGPIIWGLAYGISSRPLMPTSTKVLLAKSIQEETEEFKNSLLLSKEDIRLMKLYNMLIVQ